LVDTWSRNLKFDFMITESIVDLVDLIRHG
jgi:hypothetical protein